MDETFNFTGNPAGQPGNQQSFDGGDGNDTINIFFDGETAAAPIVTDFTENPDGSFTATYRSTQSGGVNEDRVTITNIENVNIVLRNAYGDPPFDASSNDIIRTGFGNDTIETRGGNDIIDSGRGIDNVDGGAGTQDVISKDFSDFSTDISWNIRTGVFSGPGSFVNLEAFGTLRTGSGNDTIVTSDFTNASLAPGNETVFTGAGNDQVTVTNGVDHVDMGAGSDRLIVDYTNASFPASINSILTQNPDGSYSGEHRGTASGGTRTGVTFAGVEHFTLIYPDAGGNGFNLNDLIITGDGDDVIFAGSSADRIHAGGGTDTIDGGETGDDQDGLAKEFGTAGPAIQIDLAANTYSGPGSITNIEYFIDLRTGDGADNVTTSNLDFDDVVATRGGNDTVTVHHGNDNVDLGAGVDRLVVDFATFAAFDFFVTMTVTEQSPGTYSGRVTTQSSSISVDFSGVENFTVLTCLGAIFSDNITTGAGDDLIQTYASDDRVNAGAGNDIFDGGDGNDVVYGMAGNDVLTGGAGRDVLVGGDGNDRMLGGAGAANELYGGLGDDVFVIEAAGDTIVEQAGEGTDTIETALASFVLRANVENLTGTAGTAQTLVGNDLDNRIAGGAGNDELVGGLGNDTYVLANAGDTIVEQAGGGTDTVETAVGAYTLNAANVENLTGTSNGGQSLAGNALANRIAGGTGNDEMQGFGGDDTYVVLNAGDSVIELAGQGTDTIETTLSYYTLEAAAHVENLTYTGKGDFYGAGNDGANVITGGAGADILRGGLGADTLNGGGGPDRYLFDSALGGGNVDAITGFASGSDAIWLEDSVFGAIALGTLSANAFVTGTQAQDADDRIIYDAATGALYYDADGSGAGAAVQFATLTGAPALTAGDFAVI